jgi:hypothetical protein
MKPCVHCERSAAFSVCTVISTLGIPGRRQTCTASLPFCSSCLQRVCGDGEGSLALPIREALQNGFARVNRATSEQDGNGDTFGPEGQRAGG